MLGLYFEINRYILIIMRLKNGPTIYSCLLGVCLSVALGFPACRPGPRPLFHLYYCHLS